MRNGNGEEIRRDFAQPYTVVEPAATVSATMMNMLYAGYQNPISVSVPGVPKNKVNATMSGGTLTKKGEGEYIATPSKVGEDVVITVTADNQGRSQEMGKFTFHVRKLPDPTAYISFTDDKGNAMRYKGPEELGATATVTSGATKPATPPGSSEAPAATSSTECCESRSSELVGMTGGREEVDEEIREDEALKSDKRKHQ